MAGRLTPLHRPRTGQATHHVLHQVASAKSIAGTVQAENGNLDPREVRIAQFLGLSGRMQWIGEQQQSIAKKSVRREHRGRSPSHGPASENETFWPEFLASPQRDRGDTFFEARHGVGPPGSLLPIDKVEANDMHSLTAKLLRQRAHAAIGHISTSAMRAYE